MANMLLMFLALATAQKPQPHYTLLQQVYSVPQWTTVHGIPSHNEPNVLCLVNKHQDKLGGQETPVLFTSF